MAKIYLVEDEENIRELVVYTLAASGFEVQGFPAAEPFFAAIKTELPDLVLLDIMLPGGQDGLAILKALRGDARTGQLPVIMLTAKSAEYDKILGLDAGADDYLAKPFGMMELVARIRAVLRRVSPMPGGEVLLADGIELHPEKHRVLVEGAETELTLKEFELLQLLMENPGRVLSRDVMLERVWGYSYEGETRTVDVHVRTLRQKLGAAGDAIETVRGVGYRMKEHTGD